MTDEKKYLLISMEDDKAKSLAEVLGSKTCKKIIDLLAENKELSEKDISDELKIPINTVEYNLKKLLKAELIKKSKNFFWSKKGRKIDMYKLSNKSIIISPKSSRVSSKLKSILPVAIFSGLAAVFLKIFYSSKQMFAGSGEGLNKLAIDTAARAPEASIGAADYASDVAAKAGEGVASAGAPLADSAIDAVNQTIATEASKASSITIDNANFFFGATQPLWLWFLGGALFAIIIFTLINWRKI